MERTSNMSNIIELFGGLKTDLEKQEFIQAAYVTINNLNKEVTNLKAEKKHLEELLKAAAPSNGQKLEENNDSTVLTEQICLEQIKMFKSFSRDRELTNEEARKLDIYSKILFQLHGTGKKKSNPELDKLSTDELLKLVEEPPKTENNG